MQVLRKIVDKFIADWLNRVVDIENQEHSHWPIANRQGTFLEFRVLTPALQRSLDQSA